MKAVRAQERRQDSETRAFDACTCRQISQSFEGLEILRPAVGIPGVIERVDAEDDPLASNHFCPREPQREKDGVPRRDVCGWDVGAVERPFGRDLAVADER